MKVSQKYEVSNANDSSEYQLAATSPDQAKNMDMDMENCTSQKPAPSITDMMTKKKVYLPLIAILIVAVCVACFLGYEYGNSNSSTITSQHNKPEQRNLTEKGQLVSYPHIADFVPDARLPNEYFVGLDSKYFQQNYDSLLNLTSKYPQQDSEGLPDPYVHCGLYTPSSDKPCFFDRDWLGSHCTEDNRFGYQPPEPGEGYINPCFAVRIENSGIWSPHNDWQPDVVKGSTNFDQPSLRLDCQPLGSRYKHIKLDQKPTTGFPLAFFPMTDFNEDKYLVPAVMLRVYRIGPKENVTVECRLTNPDSIQLKDSGKIRVTFFHELQLVGDFDQQVSDALDDTQEENSTNQSTQQPDVATVSAVESETTTEEECGDDTDLSTS